MGSLIGSKWTIPAILTGVLGPLHDSRWTIIHAAIESCGLTRKVDGAEPSAKIVKGRGTREEVAVKGRADVAKDWDGRHLISTSTNAALFNGISIVTVDLS